MLIGAFGTAVTLAHFCLFNESFFTKLWQWMTFWRGSKISSKIWHFRLRSMELSWITCPSQLKPAEFIQCDFLGNCVWLAKSLEGLWWSFTKFNNVVSKNLNQFYYCQSNTLSKLCGYSQSTLLLCTLREILEVFSDVWESPNVQWFIKLYC